jgi:hypothetical protein
MPIERFQSFDAARRALWLDGDDPALPDRLRRHWAFARRLNAFPAPLGVRKFRSIEEANADRDAWIRERVERLRRERSQR